MSHSVRGCPWIARMGVEAASVGLVVALVLAPSVAAAQSEQAPKFAVLYAFTGRADGATPYAGLVRDAAGNLYGTTFKGGAHGHGTVFKLDGLGKETVLHSFAGGKEGNGPAAGLIRDAEGTLYGVTVTRGTGRFGTVFKLNTSRKETILYNFTGGVDGAFPQGTLIRDSDGNLYGTTINGGVGDYGTVFKVDTTGKEIVLHSFAGTTDGIDPYGGVIRDSAGNFYGTTLFGGAGKGCPDTCGTVFKVDHKGKETVLYSFTLGSDGTNPYDGVILDSTGNLYGTTQQGGDPNCNPPTGCGTVFRLNKNGTEKVLYSFTGGSDGAYPRAGVIRDAMGNLYGAASYGGDYNCDPIEGCGTVFKLNKNGDLTVLHQFAGGKDGAYPYYGSLVIDASGNLYGTTFGGGASGYGVVFKLTP
jgi:uncharacterized repeat protein (TIGR03803 family)